MVAITGTCYWNSRCRQSCAILLVTHRCSSRIAPQLTALSTLSSYCSRRLQSSLHQTARTWTRRLLCLGLIQERVYRTALRDTADLKQRLIETWSSIPQTVINEAIDEWGLRLRAALKQRDVTSRTHCNQPALFRATHILL